MACLKGCCVAWLQSVQNAGAGLVTDARRREHTHHADSAATALAARATTSPIQGRCPGLPVSIQQSAIHRHIWQMTVKSLLTSACADSARPTRRCVLFDGHTTPSATGVFRNGWATTPVELITF